METRGKVIVITGANSGIGFATAVNLAKQGAAMMMVCRNPERGKNALKLVAEAATGQTPRLFIADMASQASIRRLGEALQTELPKIDVLINNAAGAFVQRTLTEDGIERTFATNHIGPFLTTILLLDLIKKSSEGRIINVTAGFPGALGEKFLDNLQGERKYGQLLAYRHSKLANIVFTYELARRLEGTGVTANCLHPGAIATRFGETAGGTMKLLSKLVSPFMRSAEVGARTPVYLATSPEVRHVSGSYFVHCKAKRTEPVSYDARVGERLWRLSEDLTRPGRREARQTASAPT